MSKKNPGGIKVSEKLAYSIGMLGTNVTYGLTTGYLLYYFTDVYMIPAIAVSVLMLVARLWDAINDPMMGVIADRTKTRWGKFRPYILLSGFVMAAFTIMLFFTPGINPGAKIAYAYVAYIGWGMSYTMSDIPKWSMTSVISEDKNERMSLISWAKVFGMIGNIGANLAVIPLVNFFAKRFADGGEPNQVLGYRLMAVVFAVIALLASVLMFAGTRERVVSDGERATLRDSLRNIYTNRPLLMLLLSLLAVNTATGLLSALQVHYIANNFGNASLVPVVMGIVIGPTLVGSILAGTLSKKWGRKRVFTMAILLYAVRGVAQYLVGYHNLTLAIALLAFSGLFMGVYNVVQIAMLTDTIDHAESLTGKRTEGTVFSTQTFVVKLGGAISGSVGAAALMWVGYAENAAQSAATLNGLHFWITLMPSIVALLSLIPIFFYTIPDKAAAQS